MCILGRPAMAILGKCNNAKCDENHYIAVIITSYNIEAFIERCIKSVQCQTYNKWKIYIVDDGSSDGTFEVIKRLSEKDARIVCSHTGNNGVFKARKKAIDLIEDCEYAIFVDGDDYLLMNNLFEKCIKKMESKDIDVLGFDYIHSGKRGFGIDDEIILLSREDITKNMLNRKIIDGNMPYTMYKTRLIKDGFKVRSCNNDDFLNKYEILIKANKVAYEPWTGYYYFLNKTSQTQRSIQPNAYVYYEHVREFTYGVMKEYPELGKECDYFQFWVLLWLGITILKDRDYRKHPLYQKVIPDIKKNVKVYWNNQYFGLKERTNVLLILFGGFSFVYRKYHALKKFWSINQPGKG